MITKLPEAAWQHRSGLDHLLDTLSASDGNVRYVGGAVRDGLLGLPVSDVDMATTLSPVNVLERLQKANIKAIPTGIDHGTITAICDGSPIEITTLRRDVSTDGRRATISYTSDWQEDAARRDFTINALYADPITLDITDFFGGIDDLSSGKVRFIGDAVTRIAEDHLRILRYFRFLARFGHNQVDIEAYDACKGAANSLMALSRERIADELLKLLSVDNPIQSLRLMVDGDILARVLPEVKQEGVDRLDYLISRETNANIAPSPIRRLAALLPADPIVAENVGARLKLSNKARKRLRVAVETTAAENPARTLAFHIGVEGAIDRLLLNEEAPLEAILALDNWTPPALPISGGALISRGLPVGPTVARALQAVQQQWLLEGFPDADRVAIIADQVVAEFQRVRQ